MLTVHSVLMVLAILCFFLAAIAINPPRVNLVAGGLFFWSLAVLIAK